MTLNSIVPVLYVPDVADVSAPFPASTLWAKATKNLDLATYPLDPLDPLDPLNSLKIKGNDLADSKRIGPFSSGLGAESGYRSEGTAPPPAWGRIE